MRGPILLSTLSLLRSQWASDRVLTARRDAALVEMMRYCVTRVPYYRALGIDASTLRAAHDLHRFPLLDKRTLQNSAPALIADGADAGALHASRTSGSTGEPTVTYFDAKSWAICKYALKIRRTLAVAPPVFRRCLIVSERTPDDAAEYARSRPSGYGPAYRERIVSLFDDLDTHRRVIHEFRPDIVYAFPSYMLELERAYRLDGETPPRIRWVFTSSELLTPAVRTRIESAFRGRVHDIYGCTEFKEVAWQCAFDSYHINSEAVLVETLPLSGEAGGRIVLTTLCNRAMPLLRFDTGDLGTLAEPARRCVCGRRLPQMQVISGRQGDVVSLPSGRRLSPYVLTSIIEIIPGLHQYRIVQEAPNRVRIDMVAGRAVDARVLDGVRSRLAAAFVEPITLSFRRVDEIPRLSGGKHRAFVREF